MKEYEAVIVKNAPIAEGIRELVFSLPEAVSVRAGQFVNLSVGGGHLLRRPLAVCKAEGKEIAVCFQVKGEGTKLLASMGAGMRLNVLMPLGNGFFAKEEEKKIAVVGGGVGIFPMISVIREYAQKKQIHAYIGFRSEKAVCGMEELKKAEFLTVVTDDGSFGGKMNAVQAFCSDLEAHPEHRPDVVFACGPVPMLRALKNATLSLKIPAYVSLEERMGCGIGACLVCVCDRTNGEHARVCKDGPVFAIEDIEL